MKFGVRTPSFSRSFKARTTGAAKRAVKRALIPGYGKKGMGIFHPEKALYNRVYRRTTFSIFDLGKSSNRETTPSNSGCCVTLIFCVIGIAISISFFVCQ
jgi:hypothetical protein